MPAERCCELKPEVNVDRWQIYHSAWCMSIGKSSSLFRHYTIKTLCEACMITGTRYGSMGQAMAAVVGIACCTPSLLAPVNAWSGSQREIDRHNRSRASCSAMDAAQQQRFALRSAMVIF